MDGETHLECKHKGCTFRTGQLMDYDFHIEEMTEAMREHLENKHR